MSEWHDIKTFYGYKVMIPDEYKYKEFINILDGLNNIVEDPFQFTAILSAFYMDISLHEPILLDRSSNVLIGFYVNDVKHIVDKSKELAEYVIDNPILEGIDISVKPKFYSGIDWFHTIIEDEDEDEDDDEDDDDDEDVYESRYNDEYEDE